MPRYAVSLPVIGIAVYQIEAANEEAAIADALAAGNLQDNIVELDTVEHLMEGNVLNAPLHDAEVEELDP